MGFFDFLRRRSEVRRLGLERSADVNFQLAKEFEARASAIGPKPGLTPEEAVNFHNLRKHASTVRKDAIHFSNRASKKR